MADSNTSGPWSSQSLQHFPLVAAPQSSVPIGRHALLSRAWANCPFSLILLGSFVCMCNGSVLCGLCLIPTLTGIDSFVIWNRALLAFLDRGARRVLGGIDKEPFRRPIDASRPDDMRVLRPPGEYAAAEPPSGAQLSTGQQTLNKAQRIVWDGWERHERSARAAIILTVSSNIAIAIEYKWSAADMYEHICVEHGVVVVNRG